MTNLIAANSENQPLLDELAPIAERMNRVPSRYGICKVLGLAKYDYKINDLFDKWPEHSGYAAHPVPPYIHKMPYNEYVFSSPVQMWVEGEYAEARLRLLAFCIAELQNTELSYLCE